MEANESSALNMCPMHRPILITYLLHLTQPIRNGNGSDLNRVPTRTAPIRGGHGKKQLSSGRVWMC